MLNVKKTILIAVSVLTVSMLGACGFTVEKNEAIPEGGSNDAGSTMLAGQDLPEISGVLKNADSPDEVFVTVDGKDKIFRLSEDAKAQIDNEEISYGDSVTFTTFSIGDGKDTIDTFTKK